MEWVLIYYYLCFFKEKKRNQEFVNIKKCTSLLNESQNVIHSQFIKRKKCDLVVVCLHFIKHGFLVVRIVVYSGCCI